tara:strand:- start:206 stop:622 length:417 start_codon:yes stop_codon:yes gene_type:complete
MSIYEIQRPWLWLSGYDLVDADGNDLPIFASIWPHQTQQWYHRDDEYYFPSAEYLAESKEPSTDDERGVYWRSLIRVTQRTCRRDHADGRIFKGDRYEEVIERWIKDETGESHHERTTKRILTHDEKMWFGDWRNAND